MYRCKVCGGELVPKEGQTVVKCEYCGNINAIPKTDDNNLKELLNRADDLRRNCEFDSAERAYERIIEINSKESDAYWGWILSHYGIEYVEDPSTGKRVPTCHRASFDSISANYNYKQAIKYADALQRPVYEEEARIIDSIQKEILEISRKEDPFDVFICYKETDSLGQRTQDSVIANDIYYQLTEQGYKVFYAAITLEDKLGQDYEPIIFAALNSAKVMLVVGSKPEYFNAVWVKNEWSRFLKLMKSDRSKQLYPCYKDMNPYDLPEEFSHLQALDMGKIGFINDIVRGISKIIVKKQPEVKIEPVKKSKYGVDDKISPQLKRAFLFLEDSQWNDANQYFEKVLDKDPENAEAYVGKLMINFKVNRREQLGDLSTPFNLDGNYKKAYRFASDELKAELDGYIKKISDRNEANRLDGLYTEAVKLMKKATTATEYAEAKKKFSAISSWKDSSLKAKQCYEKSEELRKAKIYADAIALINSKDSDKIKQANSLLAGISDYKDSAELIAKIPELCDIADKDKIYFSALKKFDSNDINTIKSCIDEFKTIENWRDSKNKIQEALSKIESIQEKAKQEKLEQEKIAREKEIARIKRNKKIKKISIISAIIAVVIATVLTVSFTVIIPTAKLKNADTLVNTGKYDEALDKYTDLGGYKDSSKKIEFVNAVKTVQSVTNGNYNDAIKEILDSGAVVTVDFAMLGGEFAEQSVKTLALYSVNTSAVDAIESENTHVYRSIDDFTGLPIPTRNGYKFLNWKLTNSTPNVSIGSMSITLKFSAEWQAKDYSITYELNGGSVSGKNPSGYDAQDCDITLINPTKVGYTFIGWSGTDIANNTISVTIATGSFGNRTYTANWKANTYTLTYNANGGELSKLTQTVTYDSEYTLAKTTRKGYEFKGWFTDKGLQYKSGVWNKTNDIALIAKWEIIEYSLKYNLDGGTANNKSSYTLEESFTLNNPTKKGYTFLGWTYDEKTEPVLTVKINQETGNKEYTANWQANTYAVSLDADGGVVDKTSLSVVYDQQFTLPFPQKAGFSFGGWYNGNDLIEDGIWKFDANLSLKAKWAIYTITTSSNNENAGTYTKLAQEKTTRGNTVVIECTTNNGYEFIGWFDGDIKLSAEARYEFTMPAKSITYTAKWQPISYSITYYNLDGATNAKENPLAYTVECNKIELLQATKVGYTFCGWFTNAELKAQKTSIEAGSIGNVELYAKWQANDYAVTFEENGGTAVEDKTATYDSMFTLPTITRKGYNFIGWFNGSTKYSDSVWKTPDNVTLTAKWQIITYAISYNLNGGSATNKGNYTVEDTFTLNNPEKVGYTFTGWTFNGQTTPLLSVTIIDEIGDKSFTANYSANDYTVNFDAGIGTVVPSVKTATYDKNFTLPTPTRAGYDFSGWFNGSTRYSDGVWRTPKSITLTAKWTARNDTKYTINYCLENSDDSGNTISETKTLQGTSDTTVTPEVLSYTGFISPAAQTVNIDADGNCVVNYYYKRITHTISFITNGGNVTSAQTYKYEQTINLPQGTRNEFTFGGWFTDETLAAEFTTLKMPLNDITVYAWWSEENKPYEFTYSGSSSFTINGFNGNGEKLWVPSYIGDKPVTEIKTSAFEYKTDITKVVIPDTVTSIGKGAFKGCESIIDITLPFVGESLNATYYKAVFGYIFDFTQQEGGKSSGTKSEVFVNIKYGDVSGAVWQYTCQNYYHSYYGGGSYYAGSYYYYIPSTIKNVTITVQNKIPLAAFNGCDFIESITIPTTVTSIGDYASQNCTVLKRLNSTTDGLFNIPMGVAKINQCAFKGCDEITKVVISANVTNIAAHAFNSCSQLKDVEFATGSKLETIGDYAFADCVSITELQLPSTITGIGDYAFSGCISIAKIDSETDGEMNLPENVTKIGAYAFQNLELMTKIVVPDTVMSIGLGAFKSCESIIDITLPFVGESLNAAYYNAVFGYIFDFTQQEGGKSSGTKSEVFVNIKYGDVSGAVWQYTCQNYYHSYYGGGSYYAGSYYYYIPSTIKNVTITVQNKIPLAAFNGCDFIESITIPTAVTSIGDYAFQNCTATVNQDYVPKFSYWNGTDVSTSFLGSGTVADPYRLNSAADLAYLATSVNSGEGYSRKYFTLNVDINLNNKSWTPIGNKQHPFAGVFNGNGKKIYNLSINSDLQYVGLFGYVTGTVMNLGIDSGTIAPITSGASAYVGSIAGCVSGLIENCYSKATINVNVKNMIYAGGLVGYAESSAIIRNSFASGNIIIISSDSMAYAGGLVGNNKGKIIGCLAYGNVTAKGNSESYSRNGGLVGNNTGTITDCYRSKSQVLIKYTTVGVAFNEDGTIATGAEMLEYCKANWGNKWDYSSSRPQLRR